MTSHNEVGRPRAIRCKRGHEWTPENTRRQGSDRVCKTCERERVRAHRKDPVVRARLTDYMLAWRAKNEKRYREYQRKRQAERAAFLLTIRQTLGCAKCGITDEWCLDFHHRNPAEKDRAVSRTFNNPNWSVKRIMAEIDKCDVLCANCHRRVHWEERQQQTKEAA